jgi:hypothetical protein
MKGPPTEALEGSARTPTGAADEMRPALRNPAHGEQDTHPFRAPLAAAVG